MSLPKVLSSQIEDDRATFELSIPGDLEEFAGHFPGSPILPGVVQIDWAMKFAGEHLIAADTVARDFQVKFRNPIQPNDLLTLEVRIEREKARLYFEYRSAERTMSSGRIVLESMT